MSQNAEHSSSIADQTCKKKDQVLFKTHCP